MEWLVWEYWELQKNFVCTNRWQQRQYVHVYSATSLATINKQNRFHYVEAILLNREVFMSRTYFQKSI